MSVECVSLLDSATGTEAKVLVGFGFNCFEFRVRRGDQPIDVLWSTRDFASGRERASSSGTPILFPFPGRIPGTKYSWQGQDYLLTAGDGRGNAIHGFVLDRVWRVIEQTGTKVTGQFHAARDEPALLQSWPADFRITVSYEVGDAVLDASILVENPDDRPLPCGLGTHPYFRLPLGGSSADDCVVRLPVAERWELREMLPTGKRLPVTNAAAYQAGLPFSEITMDDVFAGLIFAEDLCQASITDPGSGATMSLQFDRAFRECVVYTPPHREAICIEPYTCVPGGLALDGIDTGLRVLGPGESFQASVRLQVC